MKIRLFILMALIITTSWKTHPLKMSYTEVFVSKDKVSIKVKFFADDLSVALEQLAKKKLDLENCVLDNEFKSVFNKYFNDNFQLNSSKSIVIFKIKEISCISDISSNAKIILVTFNSASIKKDQFKTLKLKNNLLFNAIPEQKNLVLIKNTTGQTSNSLIFDNTNVDDFIDLNLK